MLGSQELVEKSKIIKIGLREKIILMGLQILLPFALYLAINLDSLPLGIAAGTLLVLSMLALVVFA